MLITAVQQSDSVIHIYILFHILFHDGLSQGIEYSCLCYTIGPCCLSILYIIVCLFIYFKDLAPLVMEGDGHALNLQGKEPMLQFKFKGHLLVGIPSCSGKVNLLFYSGLQFVG